MLRVLIADDHPIVRSGLRAVLAAGLVGAEFAEAETFDAVLAQARAARWDLVVLDVSMPGGNVLDTIRALKADHPRVAILVVSMFAEEQYATRVIRAGAAGYVMKGSMAGEVLTAARKALAGRRYVSPALAERLVDGLGDDGGPRRDTLSDREHQVLVGLAGGRSVSDIADDLALSVKTVSTYRTRLLAKLGVATNAELIRYGLEHGLVE